MPQAIGARGKPVTAQRNRFRPGAIPKSVKAQGQAAVYANDGVSAFGNISKRDLKRMRGQYQGGNKS